MAASAAYLADISAAGAALVDHFGLVDETGTELAGGAPAYARVAKTAVATGASWAPSGDCTFNVPAGKKVGGWRAYAAGVDLGGADLTQETYTQQGTYVLTAALTGMTHQAT